MKTFIKAVILTFFLLSYSAAYADDDNMEKIISPISLAGEFNWNWSIDDVNQYMSDVNGMKCEIPMAEENGEIYIECNAIMENETHYYGFYFWSEDDPTLYQTVFSMIFEDLGNLSAEDAFNYVVNQLELPQEPDSNTRYEGDFYNMAAEKSQHALGVRSDDSILVITAEEKTENHYPSVALYFVNAEYWEE